MPPRAGPLPPALVEAYELGVFDLPASASTRDPRPEATKQAQLVWVLPVILVSFADDTLAYGATTFERILFDSTGSTPTGSVYDYYRWVSGGRASVTGRVVATVRVPGTRAYYAGTSGGLKGFTPRNDLGLMRDALRICSNSVDWAPFDANRDGEVDMVWLVHAGIGGEATSDPTYLWSITARMSSGWSQAGVWETQTPYTVDARLKTYLIINRFTILPELSPFVDGAPSEIGVFCHEFGHALGLPDLFDTSVTGVGNSGPGHWSLMGFGGYGGDGSSPQYPTHLGAWPLRYLGWDQSFRPEVDTTLVIPPLGDSRSVVDWWFQGEASSEHFLIENRQRSGFDRNLPGSGLIVYHVDEALIANRLASNRINSGTTPGLQIVEADGDYDLFLGRNRGDGNDPFPGAKGISRIDDWTTPDTRTFMNQRTDIALENIAPIGADVQARIRVRSPGWLAAEDQSGPGFAPTPLNGIGRVTATDAHGVSWYVATETVSGRPQVVLRGGRDGFAEVWQVSHSSGQAYDPALALIPGGNLAIVWCDTRDGRPSLYYRSRVIDVWSAERRLVTLPGNCSSPSIVSDATGTLTVAFNYTESDRSQIRLMRFTYFSPYGQSFPITGLLGFEPAPSAFRTSTGSVMVAWIDKLSTTPRIMFARYHPDSGVSTPQALTPTPRHQQVAFTGVLDAAGDMHFAWLTTGPALSEIHYQVRRSRGFIEPADQVLESRGEAMNSIALDSGPSLALHLAYEATRSGITQIRYRRSKPGEGWDLMSTEVTLPSDGTAKRPLVFPLPEGDVAVAYTLYPAGDLRFMVRRRQTAGGTEVAAAAPGPASAAPLRIGPNPLQAGSTLRIEWAGSGSAPPGPVEVFDLAGRRIAALAWEAAGAGWRARADAAVTGGWATGVYFARASGSPAASTRIIVIR